MEDSLALCRHHIQMIKKELLNDSVYKSQDPKVLNVVKMRMSELYSLLLPVVRGEKSSSSLPPGVKELFAPCFVSVGGGDSSPGSNLFEYYLHRDLIMFPFVMDLERINTVQNSNTLEDVVF